MRRGKRSTLDSVDWVPIRRISVLSLSDIRKFEVNHLISDKQVVREEGESVEFGLLER